MDDVTVSLLRENIMHAVEDMVGRRLAEAEAARIVLVERVALLEAQVEALQTPAEAEQAEHVEAVLDGEEAAENNEDVDDAIEVVENAAEIEDEIDDVADAIEPRASHPLLRTFG